MPSLHGFQDPKVQRYRGTYLNLTSSIGVKYAISYRLIAIHGAAPSILELFQVPRPSSMEFSDDKIADSNSQQGLENS